MSGHTPEPWTFHERGCCGLVGNAHEDVFIAHFYCGDDGDTFAVDPVPIKAMRDANVRRACACVNALAGIADPADFVKRALAAGVKP